MSGARRSKRAATSAAGSSDIPDSPAGDNAGRGSGSWTMTLARQAGLWLLIVVLYSPSLSSGFIWDDDDYVTRNPALRTTEGLKRIWLDPSATPQYYPAVHTTFWIEYHLWELAPAGYHGVNIVLHATATVLLGRLLERLAIPGAWLAALLFGLHPVHVETVAWVTERKNVLSALFYLLALGRFVSVFRLEGRTSEAEEPGSRWWMWLAGFFLFVVALLSKSVTCSLPAVLVLLILWRRGRLSAREIGLLIPLFVIGGLLAWNTASLERTHVGASGATFQWTPAERFLIAGRALWAYAGLLLAPVGLCFSYPRWTIDAGSLWQWLIAISAFLMPAVISCRDRRMSGRLLAVLFFGGTLLPALGFFNIYPMRYSYIADHFQYLASIGLLALAAGWWQAWTGTARQRLGTVTTVVPWVVLVVLAGLNVQRQFVFRSPESLWNDTLAKNPTSMLAHMQRGYVAKQSGDHERAAEHFRKALDYRTDDDDVPHLRTDLALALGRINRPSEAEVEFRAVLAERPQELAAANGLASLLARQGRFDEAIPLFRSVVEQQPENVVSIINLGNALAADGQLEAAEAAYRRATEVEPKNVAALIELAKVLARQKRFAEAEAACRRVLEINPGLIPARQLLEKIRADGGR